MLPKLLVILVATLNVILVKLEQFSKILPSTITSLLGKTIDFKAVQFANADS